MQSPLKQGQCFWIHSDAGVQPVDYCGQPTGYIMEEMGGEPGAPKVRKYYAHCPHHREVIAQRMMGEE